MPAVRTTIADIAKANGSDAAVGLIEETTKAHPEIAMIPARPIKGLNYKTLVRVALPTNGSVFRNANEGVTVDKSSYINRLVEAFTLNPRWEADRAVADRYEDGPQAYLAIEAAGQVEYAMQSMATQFYYGNQNLFSGVGSTKGFPGLIDAYDATNMVVDATGTTANTGSSVWAVKFGPQAVQWVLGNNGSLDVGDVRTETLYDSNSNPFTGYVQEMLAYPGLQVGSVRAVGRIKKLTADSGKGLTDSLIADLLAKFEVGVVPDVLFMSRRSRAQLQKSRSVTIMTGGVGSPNGGQGNIAPIPTEAYGIPIAVTDAIRDTEALTL